MDDTENGLGGKNDSETEVVAKGLLGLEPPSYPLGHCTPQALHWLDPRYEPVSLRETLFERWSHSTLLLDPDVEQLVDVDNHIEPANFDIFHFPITLQRGRTHNLVVHYRQGLGTVSDEWYGIIYLMEPAKRWGNWHKTTRDIRVPTGWEKIAIRPTAQKVSSSDGYTTYRISMDRTPRENLYISGIPKKR